MENTITLTGFALKYEIKDDGGNIVKKYFIDKNDDSKTYDTINRNCMIYSYDKISRKELGDYLSWVIYNRPSLFLDLNILKDIIAYDDNFLDFLSKEISSFSDEQKETIKYEFKRKISEIFMFKYEDFKKTGNLYNEDVFMEKFFNREEYKNLENTIPDNLETLVKADIINVLNSNDSRVLFNTKNSPLYDYGFSIAFFKSPITFKVHSSEDSEDSDIIIPEIEDTDGDTYTLSSSLEDIHKFGVNMFIVDDSKNYIFPVYFSNKAYLNALLEMFDEFKKNKQIEVNKIEYIKNEDLNKLLATCGSRRTINISENVYKERTVFVLEEFNSLRDSILENEFKLKPKYFNIDENSFKELETSYSKDSLTVRDQIVHSIYNKINK